MDTARRDSLVSQFRRRLYTACAFTPFPHQAEWQLASEGWALVDRPPVEGDHYHDVLVTEESLTPGTAILDHRMVNDIACAVVRRTIQPRHGGVARILADLAAFKAGKSYGTAAWTAAFAILPDAKVHLIGAEYATAEPEFNYLADFLLSEPPRGMNMKAAKFHNDKRAGRMIIKLKSGAEFEVKSWERKEGLKGKKITAYVYCLPLDAPVWMGDYSFRRLEDVKVGDTVIGMSRVPWIARRGGAKINQKTTRRSFVRTKVTAIHRTRDHVFKLTFKSGRVAYCTGDHRWLSGRTIGVARYITPKIGARFVHAVDAPPDPPIGTEWQRGWLAGIYDGEGSRTFIAQDKEHNPATHLRIIEALRSLGFEAIETSRGVRWNGGRDAALKFLSWMQAPRYRERWADEALLISRCGTPDEISEIEDQGVQDVGCITTETENFVAYGFISHNCEAYQLPGLEVYTSLSQNLREQHGWALFPTTPDRPWVGIFHDYGHGQDPYWHCTCSVDARENPFTYDQKARDRDDPAKGGIMTKERYAIAWKGQLGKFVGRVYDFVRGDKDRYFSPESHPFLWKQFDPDSVWNG